MNITCNSCGYQGDIETFPPSMSINADCRCPKCGSTNNQHNADYQSQLNKAWNCQHTGTLVDHGTGHNGCKLLRCTECGSFGLDRAMRKELATQEKAMNPNITELNPPPNWPDLMAVKDRCMKLADLEGDHTVSAGTLDGLAAAPACSTYDMLETIQHLTDCQALLESARIDMKPDLYDEARVAHIAKWRQLLAPNESGPIFPPKPQPQTTT